MERALLFGALINEDRTRAGDPLDELAHLADTAGAVVAHRVVQRRQKVHPAFFVGRGMAETIARLAAEHEVDLLISDNDLSPAQGRNLEQLTGKRVVDRTELILDIFAGHAKTRQARLQVELAQLQYALPRLKRMWTHLDREKGGIGLRGPGEKQLESDKRIIRRKIRDLMDMLEQIRHRKERQVEARREEFTVSLVGYTNAGKSTLMNRLSGADQKVEDQLFATLDTKTALVEIAKNRRILLSDTVGFIEKIPHHLIASFHATLEEVTTAGLLLHVVDVSHKNASEQAAAVDKVLRMIGAADRPTLVVLNKIDALEDPCDLHYHSARNAESVAVSALRGTGIEDLKQAILRHMEERTVEITLDVPAGEGQILAYLSRHARVLERHCEGETVQLRLRIEERHLNKVRKELERGKEPE